MVDEMKFDRGLMDHEVLGLASAHCTLPTSEYGRQAMATVDFPYSPRCRIAWVRR